MSTLRYINGRIKNRRDTKDDWSKDNPLLYDGELALEQDTNKLKMGDGITRWNDLPYISAGLPTGSVIAFSGETIPDDWLLCNGAAIDRTEYADLFSVIGTKFGNGNGSNTFNLPNLINRFIQGTETELGKQREAGLPNITGWLQATAQGGYSYGHAGGAITETIIGSGDEGGKGGEYKTYTLNASLANPIYGKSDTVQPPSILMYYIIKV